MPTCNKRSTNGSPTGNSRSSWTCGSRVWNWIGISFMATPSLSGSACPRIRSPKSAMGSICQSADREIVHCQGRAVLSREPAPAKLEIEHLRGSGQLLAQLRLPSNVAHTSGDYVLHPGLMDGAMQAAVALIDVGPGSNQARLPFALEMLRIVSPCTAEMVAWMRHAQGHSADDVVKLDIDLCDERGNVCVQMRGLSLRVLSQENDQVTGSLLAVPVWQTSGLEVSAGAGKIEFAEHHVILCELSVGAVYDCPQSPNGDLAGGHSPPLQCLPLEARQETTTTQRYTECP